MSKNESLHKVLKALLRKPLSQSNIATHLTTEVDTKTVSSTLQTLIDKELIVKDEKDPLYKLNTSIPFCSVIILKTTWMFKALLCPLGYTEEIATIDLKATDNIDGLIEEIKGALKEFKTLYLNGENCIKTVLVAVQANLEQGDDGLLLDSPCLNEKNIPLASLLTNSLGIKTLAYDYAYSHKLSIRNNPTFNGENALTLGCSKGGVAIGILTNGQIIDGQNGTPINCSHMPYKYGFEQSLGNHSDHDTDALMYAIQTLAPLFNLHRVIVYGSTFDDHIEAIYKVQHELKQHQDPFFHDFVVEYHSYEFDEKHEELMILSYEALIDTLNFND